MSLEQYKNPENIIDTKSQQRGKLLSESDESLLIKSLVDTNFGLGELVPGSSNKYYNDIVELHLYSVDGYYVNGNHKVETWSIEDTIDPRSYYYRTANKKVISLDVYSDMSIFNYRNLPLKIVYNFHRDIVGSYLSDKKMYIREISPSRREIRVRLESGFDTKLFNQYDKDFLQKYVRNRPNELPKILVNFGNNDLYLAINYIEDLDNECIIKLLDPLNEKIDVGSKCFLTIQMLDPNIETFTLSDSPDAKTYNCMSGPNFDIETDYTIRSETQYTSWDDILNINLSSTQKILDSLSSDINTIRSNIDYSDPTQFTHYSNLTIRIKNFYTKVKKIEGYDSLISTVDSLVGNVGDTNDKYIKSKNQIISEFDDFEKWLYFSPPLPETTYDGYVFQGIIGKINPYPKPDTTFEYPEQSNWDVWSDVWNQSVIYWGKNGGTETFYQVYPYTIASSIDEYSVSWLRQNLAVAEEYDKNNIYSLRQTIPEYILMNTYNDDYIKFIDMTSHHFDILWSYITHLSRFNTREHNQLQSFPDKMLYDVTKNFGWILSNGSVNSSIGKNELGVTTGDSKLQPERDGLVTKSDKDRTHEIWRRILNNLPYIYKSKGTARGVESIINTYGIPSTILKPIEYSGTTTKTNRKSIHEFDKYTYSVKFGSNKYITIPWDQFEEN